MNANNRLLHPYCNDCGWRKGGPDSWSGGACKCGHSETPIKTYDDPAQVIQIERDKTSVMATEKNDGG